MISAPLLELKNVSVMREDRVVLHDLNLTIGAGEHVAILGPNGCGKSTLIKTITRECYPLAREGTSVRLFGQQTWNVFDLRKLLGIVSYDLAAVCAKDLKGRDVVLSGYFSSIGVQQWDHPTPEMEERTDAVLAQLDAAHLSDRWMDELSSGEARRILLGRALVHDPEALILDEPSNSLDLAAQRELTTVMRRLAQAGTTLVLVSHHLSDVIPEIERVILMKEGKILADGPKAETLTEENLQRLFGVPVHLFERDGYYHVV